MNFNATFLNFSENLDHRFSLVYIFGNMFPESKGLVAISVISSIEETCHNLFLYSCKT